MLLKFKYVLLFTLSTFGLLSINFLTVGVLSKSFDFALEQFLDLGFLLIPLSLTFGAQVVLYSLIKGKSVMLVAGSGSVNTGTMVACCAHHLSNLLPFIAFGGFASVLASSQKYLLVGALVLNVILVLYLFSKLKGSYGR